ncbi:arogenate dehydratase/prephenate dehydratase 1, chloroplastic-like protein [Cinnamomum micranthum f. kanehirae]|uniref:Arogenate dehydratase/prephenate dehydratase 1, chloroplastic-like protein n=1 Tax=Cinnamomum micranthum f. kanehirae TaxID=337451 RepID=A0A443NNK2_9MAGN|nr:arogenate dehydratase/prephenate dehydratase 1, chloroplastic-like protein [Cinnamomum micranthum f. kanehirae]
MAPTKKEKEVDPRWEHREMVGGDRHKVECKWCHKIMSGGIHRFKQHLAHISGDAKGHPNVPTEVRKQMREIFFHYNWIPPNVATSPYSRAMVDTIAEVELELNFFPLMILAESILTWSMTNIRDTWKTTSKCGKSIGAHLCETDRQAIIENI